LVTFRLDPEEYAALRHACVSSGARSISEFAREAVLNSVEAGGPLRGTLGGDLVTLTERLQELDRLLKAASGLIERVLGGDNRETNTGKEEG
jgi:hypothetical protein